MVRFVSRCRVVRGDPPGMQDPTVPACSHQVSLHRAPDSLPPRVTPCHAVMAAGDSSHQKQNVTGKPAHVKTGNVERSSSCSSALLELQIYTWASAFGPIPLYPGFVFPHQDALIRDGDWRLYPAVQIPTGTGYPLYYFRFLSLFSHFCTLLSFLLEA